MKVVFFSNYLNHHQVPLCEALYRLTDGQFVFVATEPVSEARRQLGYADLDVAYPFVLMAYADASNQRKARALALESDVVIIGQASDAYVIKRLRQKKLTFRYSERYYKQGLNPRNFFRRAIGAWLRDGRFQRYPLYMLCAGGYVAADCAIFANYLNRAYKWGYFPEFRKQDLSRLFALKQKNTRISLLWVGRLIPWKHPDTAVQIARQLFDAGYDFDLNILGSGEMYTQLQDMILQGGLGDCVHLRGAVSPEMVRSYMDAADIFLFTSDFNEGWGAVLNEAMNSACAVVASHEAGSVPFLVQDGRNGLIYKNGDSNGLYRCIANLIERPQLRIQLGQAAYCTLDALWNAELAAQRFLRLAQMLIDGKMEDLYPDGPCSQADILEDEWYKDETKHYL